MFPLCWLSHSLSRLLDSAGTSVSVQTIALTMNNDLLLVCHDVLCILVELHAHHQVLDRFASLKIMPVTSPQLYVSYANGFAH